MTGVAESVIDPETHVSVAARARARLRTQAAKPDAGAEAKADVKLLDGADGVIPLSPIGSGSDFSPFFDHLGVSTINLGFGGEAEGGGGVYHSLYDTYEHFTRFEDPGLVYGKILSATVGHAVIRAADAEMPLQSPNGFAAAIALYVAKVKDLANDQREAAATQQTLLAANAFALAADPTEPHGPPVAQSPVPAIDFTALDAAVTKLAASASAYEAAIDARKTPLEPAKLASLQAMMNAITQTLCSDAGLPGRPWFKNVIYAPGRYIGYGVTTLPGVTEAIDQQQWSDVPRQVQTATDALNAYTAGLEGAIKLLRS
jgi:N-acetylated-alpha-linked acidic dipeptidase